MVSTKKIKIKREREKKNLIELRKRSLVLYYFIDECFVLSFIFYSSNFFINIVRNKKKLSRKNIIV